MRTLQYRIIDDHTDNLRCESVANRTLVASLIHLTKIQHTHRKLSARR
jgi:hypothetical protein